jgi:hypothetical protein
MDKIKPYLEVLKKHHFWVLSGLVVLLCSYGWYTGTAAFDSELSANQGKIRSAISAVDMVLNTANPPNESFAEGLQGVKQQQIQSTMSAWNTLYDRQKEILRWSIKHDRLANLKPDEEIPKEIRDEYMHYFARNEDYWPKLFEIVDPLRLEEEQHNQPNQPRTAPRPASGGLGANLGGLSKSTGPANQPRRAGEGPKPPQVLGIVEWPESERNAIKSRYVWQRTPSDTQVRVAQEDYWIYKALLEIIAAANKSAGATRQSNAAIKRIDQLAIAQSAWAPSRSSIERLPPEALPPSDAASSVKVPGANATDQELLAGRYITESTDGTPGGPADAGGTEFKLVPVLMRLTMDERRIPNLLVACANSPLPVEVQQVLYNPSGGPGRAAAPTPSSGGGGGTGGFGGFNLGGAAAAARPTPSATSAGAATSESDLYEATVEVRGVVYIFNPPSKAALGLPDDEAQVTETGGIAAPRIEPEPPANVPTEPAAEEPGVPAADAGAQPVEANPEEPAADGLPRAVPAPTQPGEVPPAEAPEAPQSSK